MSRSSNLKFFYHIIYLVIFSFITSQRINNVVKFKRIDRYLVDMKHILLWHDFYNFSTDGQKVFIASKCEFKNCYVTANRSLFGDIRYFDAIIFNAKDVSRNGKGLPEVRGKYQKYIFAANDSAEEYPVCDNVYDDFFNWTWTYRVESAIPYRVISVFNLQDEELDPRSTWIKNMQPIDAFQKSQLVSKSKAAAIFLDKCKTHSKREKFIKKLAMHLANYNLTIDIFGACGPNKCKRRNMAPCHWRIRKDYFFYLAFEDALTEDFMTTAVLNGYNNNAIPIVYGYANYEEILPPNSYLDALKMPVDVLAGKMYEIMKNRDMYHNFFRWKNHYLIKNASPVLDPCSLCEALNSKAMLQFIYSYKDFRMWWNHYYQDIC